MCTLGYKLSSFEGIIGKHTTLNIPCNNTIVQAATQKPEKGGENTECESQQINNPTLANTYMLRYTAYKIKHITWEEWVFQVLLCVGAPCNLVLGRLFFLLPKVSTNRSWFRSVMYFPIAHPTANPLI